MTGVGEQLLPLSLPSMPCVMVNPRVPVATKDVFQELGLRNVTFNSPIFSFRSTHPNGCNFLFCDGSVKFLNQNIDMATYKALGSRAGGEALGSY